MGLWCIREIFTFIHIGGSADNIEVITGLQGGRAFTPSFRTAAMKFDVCQCQATDPRDSEKILAMIGKAFGSIDRFNSVAGKLLDDCLGLSIRKSTQRSSTASTKH